MCWKTRKLTKKGACFWKFAETPWNYSANGTLIALNNAQVAEIRHDGLTATTDRYKRAANWALKKAPIKANKSAPYFVVAW